MKAYKRWKDIALATIGSHSCPSWTFFHDIGWPSKGNTLVVSNKIPSFNANNRDYTLTEMPNLNSDLIKNMAIIVTACQNVLIKPQVSKVSG